MPVTPPTGIIGLAQPHTPWFLDQISLARQGRPYMSPLFVFITGGQDGVMKIWCVFPLKHDINRLGEQGFLASLLSKSQTLNSVFMKTFFKKCKKPGYIAFFCLLNLFVFSSPIAFADKVVLKNGRSFTGTIRKQTATHVTLDIGGGSISFRRSGIESIVKGDNSASSAFYRKPVNVLLELDPPNELMDVANTFKKLKNERAIAISAKKKAQNIKNDKADLLKKFAQEKKHYFAAAQRVSNANPNYNAQTYNGLVHQQNRSANTLKVIQQKISTSFKEVSSNEKTITRYLLSLDKMQQQVKARKPIKVKAGVEEQAKLFWRKLDKKLYTFNDELKRFSIAHQESNGHMILTVRINERAEGRFLLDTGATFVTMSQEMANRLNLHASTSHSIPLSIADGSLINGKVVVLSSMSVGGVRASQVPAVILPSPPKQGIDGLLGMSFLREFVVNIDSANNKIIFERFEP